MWQEDGTWEKLAAEEVLRAAGTQSASKYIGCRQATVVQWVALHSLLEVYMHDIGYNGEVRKRQL